MGWFWQSSASIKSSPSSHPPPQLREKDLKGAEDVDSESGVHAHAPLSLADPKVTPPTRDELADAEFQALLQQLRQDESIHDESAPLKARPRKRRGDVARLEAYPDHLSCSSAFDLAWWCQSPGGQIAAYYRYGTWRTCSELWSKFWFCMRTNRGFMTEEERVRRIHAWHRERENVVLAGRNSEDIWKARTEPLVGAFKEPLDMTHGRYAG